jgi:hypothetical protein
MGGLKKQEPHLAGNGSHNHNVALNEADNSENSPTRQARWQAANPIARWSHLAVASAIRRGILVKPERCEACGSDGQLDGHHDDHRQPLNVKWWCRACHVRHHARKRKVGQR